MREHTYDLIVASASRPVLLARTLNSLLTKVDVLPQKIIVHDDAAFPDLFDRVSGVVNLARGLCRVGTIVKYDAPPIRHGPALVWLLSQTDAEYVLYTQDDHEVVRPLPIARCLDVMKAHDLWHVRFNKRATMDYKDTWQGKWFKKEFSFPLVWPAGHQGQVVRPAMTIPNTLTVSDHWYFQTSLWKRGIIASIVRMWASNPAFAYRCEDKINSSIDGALKARGLDPRDPDVRAAHARTFIWGKIGDDRYVEHIGGAREDWARPRDEKDSER